MDLDFHAIMHWGEDAALEKHYVPTRSQRTRSVLTFFAQDAASHTLVYANADISKATQAREVLVFCDHWNTLTGTDPRPPGHGPEAHHPSRARRTRRARRHVHDPADALTRPDPPHRGTARQRVAHRPPGPRRRIQDPRSSTRPSPCPTTPTRSGNSIITGLGRETPTVIITNDPTSHPEVPHRTLRPHG